MNPPYQRFHVNLINFLDLIIDLWPDNYRGIPKDQLISSRDDLSKEIDSERERFLSNFIQKTHQYWLDLIPSRNEEFLSKCLDTILILPPGQVQASSDLIMSDDLDYTDIEGIWDFIDSFVSISLVDIHEKRNPIHRLNWDNHRYQPIYTRDCWNNIDLIKYSKKYPNVKLEWKP